MQSVEVDETSTVYVEKTAWNMVRTEDMDLLQMPDELIGPEAKEGKSQMLYILDMMEKALDISPKVVRSRER
jgi:hypothetical protein